MKMNTPVERLYNGIDSDIEFVDELPKTISGKIKRTELRK